MNTAVKLWNRNFITYLIGFELGEIAWGFAFFALPLHLLLTTNDPALLGTVLSLAFVPFIFLMPIGGIISDRFPKNRLLLIIHVLFSILIGTYLLLFGHSSESVLTIITLIIMTCLTSFNAPAGEALVPSIVPESELMKANSASWIGGILSNVGSPIMAGFILNIWGLQAILIISFFLYILTFLCNSLLNVPYKKQEKTTKVLEIAKIDLIESITFITKTKPKLLLVAILLIVYGITAHASLTVLTPVLVSTYLGLDSDWVGIATGVISIGGIVGVFMIQILKNKANINNTKLYIILMNFIMVLLGIGIIISTNQTFILVLIMIGFLVSLSIGNVVSLVCFTYIGAETPDHLVGKVMAINMSIVSISMVGSNYIYGWLLERFYSNQGIAVLILPGLVVVGILLFMANRKLHVK